MKKKILFFAVALTASTYFTSCVETDPVTPPADPTKEELLAGSASKSWGISKLIIGGYDMVSLMQPCERDDIMIFKRSMILTFDEGASKCEPSNAQSYDGSWSFSSDKSKITIIDDGDTTVGTIAELTNSTMRLTTTMDSAQVELTLIAK